MDLPPPLRGVDPTLLLVLNLAGTFVFGLSGGLAAVRARLDMFGVIVLAVTVGMAGGILRDVLLGIPPQTLRDWRYVAVAASAGLLTFVAHGVLAKLERPIPVFDAAGLALFCVTGAATALAQRVGAVEAVALGAVTGVGGGVLRDVLLREVPTVLRHQLYAIPALLGAAVAVIAREADLTSPVFPLLGAALCFTIRMLALYRRIDAPTPVPRRRRDD